MTHWNRLGKAVEDWFSKLPHEEKIKILGENLPPSSAVYFFKKKPVEYQVKKYLERDQNK